MREIKIVLDIKNLKVNCYSELTIYAFRTSELIVWTRATWENRKKWMLVILFVCKIQILVPRMLLHADYVITKLPDKNYSNASKDVL